MPPDLSLDARLLYVSSSIEDILGYQPHEVVGKSCWEFFHPDEIPFARSIHGRSIQLDKAAVLNYCQIKNKNGLWVGCECVFTIVHDVLVASTSIYRGGPGSQSRSHPAETCSASESNKIDAGRAIEAPVIRQLFSSSPRDPRYHMLSYISQKFSQETRSHSNEPRAALFLNRFSRTLAIMYATNGLASLLGISADRLIGKSFYFCIQENCLREAVKCLESAKANDSIAYLRFWFRDPTQDQELDPDDRMSDGHSTTDDDDGGVHLSELMDHDESQIAGASDSSASMRSSMEPRSRRYRSNDQSSRSPSGNSTDMDGNAQDALFDQPAGGQSSTSSISTPDESQPPQQTQRQPWASEIRQVELEAVVSCTSDGLVVVLRGARPFVPDVTQNLHEPTKSPYVNGFFASPWANNPIIPDVQKRSNPVPNSVQPLRFPVHPTAEQADMAATRGPSTEDFMNSIREVAVFAWSLIGINGSLVKYSRGTPSGESQPPNGLPVWEPSTNTSLERRPAIERFPSRYSYSPIDGAPIYDQMQIDDHIPNGQTNGTSPRNLFTNGFSGSNFNVAGPSGGRELGQPLSAQSRTGPRSTLKNAVSVNDFSPRNQSPLLQNQIYRGAEQGQNHGMVTGSQVKYAPDGVQIKAEPPSSPNGYGNNYLNGDHPMDYDPYAPDPSQNSLAAMNGTATHQQQQDSSFDSRWRSGNAPQEQAVNGYSRWG